MRPGTQAYQQVAAQSRRDELIMAHLGLVRHVIGRMLTHMPAGVDVENLESAGTLGLVEAATKFDPERGIKFETFAHMRIRGAVVDELRRNCPLPQHVLEQVSKVKKAYEDLSPGATVEQLAKEAGLTPDEVADSLAAMRLTRMISLEHAGEKAENRLTDANVSPENLLEVDERKKLLAEAIQTLPERERLVVSLYYLEDLRLREIGKLLKLSESRVSRVLNTALYTIGEYIRAREE